MTFEDILPIMLPATFVACLILERLIPARAQPRIRFWVLRGVVSFVMVAALNAIIPAVVMAALGDRSVLHLQGLGTAFGALVMLVVGDLLGYWIHRGVHTSERVWRWTHQMHHSAERMDMAGAVYFHPLDVIVQQVAPSIVVAVLLGVSPMAAAVGGFLGFFFGVTPHLNVRSPTWLGYVFQRPEMHAIHHQRGVHAYNYGQFALSDILFGTWRNPPAFPDVEFGFWDGASSKLGAMLVGRDVTRPGDLTN
jgi:sterol desaturase/sphingolipid hydroxylase (fatty acid hydroxylase superfamily)